MSGFKDTFTKEDTGEKTLDYDESAFYYFALVLLLFIIIPLAWSTLNSLLFAPKEDKPILIHTNKAKVRNCPCSVCKDKLNSTKVTKKRKNSRFTFGLFLKISFLVVLGYALYFTILGIQNSPKGIK